MITCAYFNSLLTEERVVVMFEMLPPFGEQLKSWVWSQVGRWYRTYIACNNLALGR